MRPPCVFCSDGCQKGGKLLKCLHKVCYDCLTCNVQPDGRIRCKTCRRATPCPPPGRDHEQVLVDDSMLNNVTQGSEELSARRVRPCSRHPSKELLYFCAACREVVCETCKIQSRHASHLDRIVHATTEATALRHRLHTALNKLVPAKREKEVERSLAFAEELLEAAESNLKAHSEATSTIGDVLFAREIDAIEDRKQKLLSKADEICRAHVYSRERALRYYRRGMYVSREVHNIIDAMKSDEDLLKMRPNVIRALKSNTGNIVLNSALNISLPLFLPQELSHVQLSIQDQGKVADNSQVDLSRSTFCICDTVTFVNKKISIVAQLRKRDGTPVTKHMLKTSSIQMFAVSSLPIGSLPLALTHYSEGEVRGEFRYHKNAVFLLEMHFNTPSPMPLSNLRQALCRSDTERDNLLVVYENAALYIDPESIVPAGHMFTGPTMDVCGTVPFCSLIQLKNGLTIARAQRPLNFKCPAFQIYIWQHPSEGLEIGLTSGAEAVSHRAQFHTLVSSNNGHRFGRACQVGDSIIVKRSPGSRVKYQISCHFANGEVSVAEILLPEIDQPILTIKMCEADCGISVTGVVP